MEQPNNSAKTATDVHRIEIGVDWPPGHVAVYLVDGPEPVLFDAGMPGDEAGQELRNGLDRIGCPPSDIEHIVLTHPHIDHIGQIPALIEGNSPTISAPSGARNRLSRESESLERAVKENAIEAGLTGKTLEDAVAKSVESLERNRTLLAPEQVDQWIEHGQQFTAGELTLHAIHTPGHQADHLCYDTLLNGEEILFSGDILLEPFRTVMIHTGLDTGVEEGVPAFFLALDRLSELGSRQIFPGHGRPHSDLSGKIERSRKSIERMVERTRETVVENGTTALALAERRAGERSFHYVLPEVVSALQYLESRGEIDSTLEDGIRNYHAVDAA